MTPADEFHAAGLAALDDFGARVAHMKGVFRLTAEREQNMGHVSLEQWLQACLWWFFKGRAGLEGATKQRPRSSDGQPRELLTQAHVDLAKAWWITTDVLDNAHSSPTPGEGHDSGSLATREIDSVRAHLRALTLSMSRNNVMPPYQSLIQGQDTTIWVEYPRFAPDVASVLRGNTSKSSLVMESDHRHAAPLEAMPLSDTRDSFCYNRMFVNVSVNTEDADTDRVVLPCVLSVTRSRSDYLTTVLVASQNDLVNITINPGSSGTGKGPTWHDVSWKARSHGIYVRLPRGFTLNIEFQEHDFRGLWNMVEYTKKVATGLKPGGDEKLLHEAQLVELQYSDAANPRAFPADKLKRCSALIFEKHVAQNEGSGVRKLHRGYRLLIITNPASKTLCSASHDLGKHSVIMCDSVDDSGGYATLVVRVREEQRQCRILLVFKHAAQRQEFHDMLKGCHVGPDEVVDAQASLQNLTIEPTAQAEAMSQSGHGLFQSLRWRDARVINRDATDAGQDQSNTVLSESLRIAASHACGAFTDRLNLGKSPNLKFVLQLLMCATQVPGSS